jgi:hypothetical protein
VEDAIFESTVYRPAIVVANKTDLPQTTKAFREVERSGGGLLRIVPISCKTGYGLEELGFEIFKVLDIIRVYTKEPNDREPSLDPFILKRGTTIHDLAKQIHSDFIERFTYARVWSQRLPFSPQRVGLTFLLEDTDIVELRIR